MVKEVIELTEDILIGKGTYIHSMKYMLNYEIFLPSGSTLVKYDDKECYMLKGKNKSQYCKDIFTDKKLFDFIWTKALQNGGIKRTRKDKVPYAI